VIIRSALIAFITTSLDIIFYNFRKVRGLIAENGHTLILAQLSEEPLINRLHDDLLSEDGSEIYVKSTDLYFSEFPQTVRFVDLIGLAAKRDEVCLGIRKGNLSKDGNSNFGVRLNLPKSDAGTAPDATFTKPFNVAVPYLNIVPCIFYFFIFPHILF
jgi:hypothetical protein